MSDFSKYKYFKLKQIPHYIKRQSTHMKCLTMTKTNYLTIYMIKHRLNHVICTKIKSSKKWNTYGFNVRKMKNIFFIIKI